MSAVIYNYKKEDVFTFDTNMKVAALGAAALLVASVALTLIALDYHNQVPAEWDSSWNDFGDFDWLDFGFDEFSYLGQINKCAHLRWCYFGAAMGALALGVGATAYAVTQKVEKERAVVFLNSNPNAGSLDS